MQINLPKDFENRMRNMLGCEYPSFLDMFLNDEIYVGIRLNKNKKNTELLFSKILEGCERVAWCDDGYYCSKSIISGNHPYHLAGMCYFQEPSAMSVVEALKIEQDDYVLDLCAAPGGKATQAGLKLSDDGLLVANEIIPKRAQILAENIERMGISNAIVTNEAPEKLVDKFEGFFDKIIVDAPCSGEGMFRKETQAIEEWSINHTKTCAVRQGHILDCAYKMLSPGGRLVYSTCTFAPVENEEAVGLFLQKYPDMSLVETGLDMLSDGRNEWSNSKADVSLTKRIFPHKNKGEGHFLAVFKKSGNKSERNFVVSKADRKSNDAVKFYREFEKETLNVTLDGDFKLFGDNLYLVPHSINLDKLKVVRAGLHLGVIKKNRFEPSHALLLSLSKDDFKKSVSFECYSVELLKYLHGETLMGDFSGYIAVCVDENPIGWAKGSQGILKNHYPKYLRLLK